MGMCLKWLFLNPYLGFLRQLIWNLSGVTICKDEGNIMDFYVNGDVAPGGRFNFVYCSVGD